MLSQADAEGLREGHLEVTRVERMFPSIGMASVGFGFGRERARRVVFLCGEEKGGKFEYSIIRILIRISQDKHSHEL